MADHGPLLSSFLQQEFTTKITKGDENIHEDSFVFFVSFVVKLLLGS
jgi:hypothetical protein